MMFLDEAQVKLSLLELLRGLGYKCAYGPDIPFASLSPERIRYALLPKLLSGEIRIRDAAKMVEYPP